MKFRLRTRIPSTIFAVCLLTVSATAQLPQIRLGSVFPPGGQIGTTFGLTVTATDADEATELLCDHPGLRAVIRRDAAGNAVANTFDVTVDKAVPAGVYDVRLRGLFGISNPRAVRIDTLAEAGEAEPNNTPDAAQPLSIGSIVNAKSNAQGDVDHYVVDVGAGAPIVIRTEAAAIDSTVQPVIDVFDENGRRLAASRRLLERDASVVVRSEIDQRLTIRVRDLVYAGNESANYRLIADTRPLVDFVRPSVVPKGAAGFVELFGRHLPGGELTELQLDGQRLSKRTVRVPAQTADGPSAGSVAAAAGLTTVRWNGVEGNLTTLSVCEGGIPIYRDSDPIVADGRTLDGPFTVAGQFEPRQADDVIRFFAKKGEVRDIEVVSQRLGFPANPRLVVEQVTMSDDGKESLTSIAVEIDGGRNPGTNQLPTFTRDPAFRLTASVDGIYQLRIRDTYGTTAGHPDRLYVINVRRPRPDFHLIAFESIASTDGTAPPTAGAISLRKGGRYEVPVYVLRESGHNAPITVTARNLPEGVTCRPAVIAPGQSSTRLMLEAAEDAADVVASVTITGSAEGLPDRAAQVATLVHAGKNGLPRTGRVTTTMLLHVMKDVQPFQVNVEPQSIEASKGQSLDLKLRLIRRNDFKGKVDVSFPDVPPNVEVPAVAFEPEVTEATAKITVKENANIGSAQLIAIASATVPYRRNPWKAERAHARVAEVQAQIDLQEADRQAAQATRDEAAAELQQLTQSIAQWNAEETLRAKEVDALAVRLAEAAGNSTAADALKRELADPSEQPNQEPAALEAVARNVSEAADELAETTRTIADLTKTFKSARSVIEELTEKQQTAGTRQAELQKQMADAENVVAGASAQLELLTTQRADADKVATAADEAAKPTDVNVRFPSNPVSLQIKEAK